MSKEQQNENQLKRDKRRRVARMKSFIVYFLMIWILVTTTVMAGLIIKTVSLQRQINLLVGQEGKTISKEDTSSDSGDSGGYLQTYGNAQDNIASPEDTRKVYLTFDDGPSANTDAILDTLDDYGVKATFFCVGREDDHSKDMYRRIVEEGHTLGMHSYSHKYADIYSSVEAFSSDLDRIQNLIYDVTGVDSIFYRFPGGSSNQVSNVDMKEYIKYLNEHGITYFDWNVSSGDATSQAYTSEEVINNVMSDAMNYKTSVVLLHDTEVKDATVAALPKLIESLQTAGAVLLPIDEDTTLIQHVSLQN